MSHSVSDDVFCMSEVGEVRLDFFGILSSFYCFDAGNSACFHPLAAR